MNLWRVKFYSILVAPMGLLAQELPLPEFTNAPQVYYSAEPLLKPNVIIKPPTEAEVIHVPSTVAHSMDAEIDKTLEMKLLLMEREIIVAQIEKRIHQQAELGKSSELKQVLLVSDAVADKLHQSAPPEMNVEGAVAVLGLESNAEVMVDGFIGTHITPESEKAILKQVEAELNADQPKRRLNVSVAGWWPESGVLAVRVGPPS